MPVWVSCGIVEGAGARCGAGAGVGVEAGALTE